MHKLNLTVRKGKSEKTEREKIRGKNMSKRESEIKEVREIVLIFLVAIIATAFVFGIWIGKETAIHNCYMVTENADTYVLNFNGTEHLYLK